MPFFRRKTRHASMPAKRGRNPESTEYREGTTPMIEPNAISRRTVLRGIGCAMSLPLLEAMGPVTNWSLGGPTVRPAPNRMAFVYVPNGKNMVDWTPKTEGPFDKLELPAILEPLADVCDDFLILTGLAADKAWPHGD